MKILSIHSGHDPNITIMDGDNLVHVEEERFSRVKHESNDISKKMVEDILKDINPDITVHPVIVSDTEEIHTELNDSFPSKGDVYISHHLAHAAYGYYTRPENIDKCDVLVLDGWGWETDRYFYNQDLELVDSTPFGLGMLWDLHSERFFDKFHMEGKLMGMSAYGSLHQEIYDLYTESIKIMQTIIDIPKTKRHYDKIPTVRSVTKLLTDMYNEYDVQDIAHTLQKFSEDKVYNYLKEVKTSNNLVFSGGVALNGYINQLVSTLYENVHIPPAASDTGISMGGVLLLSKRRLIDPAYVGWKYNTPNNTKHPDMYNYISDKIIEGKIVGWYQGRSESGPRALGNRSILADPRSGTTKEYINKYIKHREWYRPYAPVILEEECSNWFEDGSPSPFMSKIRKYKKGKGELVSGVCHIDYTGRLQTVSETSNKKLYLLVKCFFEKTGVPILLNTSFNVSEPIVESPEDAIKTFEDSDLDILVLGDYIIEKPRRKFLT